MVEHVLAKDETGVRFSYSAQNIFIFMANKSPKIENSNIPEYVTHVTKTLKDAGFESFLVGGCVRDLLINRTPKDWDITTNAEPEEIISLFEKTIYENNFGTVAVCIPKKENNHKNKGIVARETSKNSVTHVTDYHILEITPYRIEAEYKDFRHPKEVKFSKNIEDDLKRRDFTINALAYDPYKRQIIDLYKGQEDIKDNIVKAVNDPTERFQEDALRMLRAVRFSAQLDFVIEYNTMQAIVGNSCLLKNISKERIRDEFIKIIESKNSSMGVGLLSKLGLLKYIVPELEEGINCMQGGAHVFDVFEHNLQALEHATKKDLSLRLRLAALFHDIGKPRSRRKGTKKEFTFYGHEVIGARMVKKILENLKFPKKDIDFIVSMVRNHMFFSDTEQITLSAVRRIVQKVGKNNIWDLMKVREADRVGMKKKEAPYRLRKYHAMIEEVLHDPISVGQLKINGETLIKTLHMKPGPRIGWILHALLEEVLDNPNKNKEENLIKLAKSLNLLVDKELESLGKRGERKKERLEEKEIEKLHEKHRVK